MAVPAKTVLERYPSFMLAHPDIFRRPWDAVVRPDKILKPGKKFFLFPRRTMRKLRRRISRYVPKVIASSTNNTVAAGNVLGKNIISTESYNAKPDKAKNRRVRFVGIDTIEEDTKVTWQPSLTSITEIDA